MKLSKEQSKKHNEALKLLEKETLNFHEKVFVLENFHEGATNINSLTGAFFTPYGLARDFYLDIFKDSRLIDLCAGIGMLSFFVSINNPDADITCIELNHKYIEVGKKIIPSANWIQADALDLKELQKLGRFDQAISNPPFGKVKTGTHLKQKYKGSEFEFKIIDIASNIADYGAFLLPQMSTPFRYSGDQNFRQLEPDEQPQKLRNFIKQTGLTFEFNTGIDTGQYLEEWKGVKPLCEIVNFDFTELVKTPKIQDFEEIKPMTKTMKVKQLSIFDVIK